MSQNQFDIILTKIKTQIKKQNTTFRETVSPEESCLRYEIKSLFSSLIRRNITICCKIGKRKLKF